MAVGREPGGWGAPTGGGGRPSRRTGNARAKSHDTKPRTAVASRRGRRRTGCARAVVRDATGRQRERAMGGGVGRTSGSGAGMGRAKKKEGTHESGIACKVHGN